MAARSTRMMRCSMRSAVVATGATATWAGSRSICAARSAMARGMVAENISVCRSAGSLATILRMSLMKPMSSMRSASSSTKHSTLVEAKRIALNEIEQPAGRGDQNVDAVEQRADLRAHRHAADRQRRLEAQMAAIGAEAVEDLAGQFAGRAQHQDAAAFALERARIRGETMQDRQREGRGLAGAGLRDADHVAARHDDRDGLRLDRGRGGVFFFGEGTRDRVVKIEVVKIRSKNRLSVACACRGRCAKRRGRHCGEYETPRAIWAVDGVKRASQKPSSQKAANGARTRGSPPAESAATFICAVDVFVSRQIMRLPDQTLTAFLRLLCAALFGRLLGLGFRRFGLGRRNASSSQPWRRGLVVAAVILSAVLAAQRLQSRHLFADFAAIGLIFHHGLGAVLGAFFFLEIASARAFARSTSASDVSGCQCRLLRRGSRGYSLQYDGRR